MHVLKIQRESPEVYGNSSNACWCNLNELPQKTFTIASKFLRSLFADAHLS